MDLNVKFDMLFGPSYKGIPIVVSTSIALKNQYNINTSYSFNRKEEKKYGEQGQLIGGDIKNKNIIILDDVITSGMSINHSINIIEKENAKISSIFVLLDRKEKQENNLSQMSYLKKQKNYKINSIITIHDLIKYLSKKEKLKKYVSQLIQYYTEHGTY